MRLEGRGGWKVPDGQAQDNGSKDGKQGTSRPSVVWTPSVGSSYRKFVSVKGTTPVERERLVMCKQGFAKDCLSEVYKMRLITSGDVC